MSPLTLYFRVRWIHVPAAMMIALLQRTPVLRIVVSADYVLRSYSAVLIKSGLVAAAFGALHSRAGATTFSTNPTTPATANLGQSFTMVFAVTGTPTPAASYRFSSNIPPGLSVVGGSGLTVNSSTATLSGTPTQSGTYNFSVTVTNGPNQTSTGTMAGPVTFFATINVVGAGPPSFTTQPQSQTVMVGANVTFTAEASGGTITYQWRKDGSAIAGATGTSLTLNNVQLSQAGSYTAVATNSDGSTTSAAALLTVNAPPVIVDPPVSATVAPGGSISFTVTAAGSTPFSYQWRRNGADLGGATGATLMLGNLSTGDSGDYTVAVGNAFGTATSLPATLLVATPQPGRLVNISVRTQSLLGDKVLIAGFVLSGSGSKSILVRAMGPALTEFGVTGVMADPQLDLVPLGGTSLAQNNNWGGTAELKDAFARTGAFLPQSDASLDSALLLTLPAGLYTAIASGVNTTTGIVLAEVYDAGTSDGPRLVNLSARTEVGTGDNVLIAGFVFDGNVPKRLLIRAIGPELSRFGVSGVLANPSLRLHAFPSGTLLAENDNWGGTAALKTTFQSVGAFEITNDTSTDAALSVVLTPGLYTAVVSGVGGGTGVALVEVYEVP